jgi:beta-phosphoglucomutase-like phosphatase (HAD superfamily)
MQVVFEYEGVLVEDNARLHSEAWAQVAEEEDKPRPLHFALQRAQGMKNEQVNFHFLSAVAVWQDTLHVFLEGLEWNVGLVIIK